MISTSSLSIYPALSLPSFSASSSCSCNYSPRVFSFNVSCSCTSRLREPITLLCLKTQSLQYKRSKELRVLKVRTSSESASTTSKMTITEYRGEEEDENPPPLLESEMNSSPRRIALFVEPSPFS